MISTFDNLHSNGVITAQNWVRAQKNPVDQLLISELMLINLIAVTGATDEQIKTALFKTAEDLKSPILRA